MSANQNTSMFSPPQNGAIWRPEWNGAATCNFIKCNATDPFDPGAVAGVGSLAEAPEPDAIKRIINSNPNL
ncbi:hypothetical protein ZHAS_00011531 [Anopheles sinensis]|uniref:Uncharacterized protein n=1 Tax=Anopheles sinensis TaxID=74873 RepID=A0A084W050_ANOSI|nr:hypothetical protein ZHAS_00011531 [Anopheles sinensis]